MSKLELVYDVDEKSRSFRDTVVYAFQWFVTLFYCVVWGYAIVGVGLGLTGTVLASYMGAVVLMIGVSTFVQCYAGHRFAMVSGPNIIPSLAILAALAIGGKAYALQAFNAQLIAGFVIIALGATGVIGKISKVWSPLVLGSMVMMIGLTITGVGVGLITAFGPGWPMWVGLLLGLSAGIVSIKLRGFLSTIPTLFVIVIGYAIFILAGKFDWALVHSLPLLNLPKVFPFGGGWPPLDLIGIMIIVNLMAALNLYGSVTGWGSIVGHPVSENQARRSFTVSGAVETTIAGLLGVPSLVPYGENLGIITLTRVAARFFILIGAVVFIIMGFFGPVGGFMAAMPKPVAGAILIGIASTVIGLGADIWHSEPFGRREILVTGFSIFLCFGLYELPSTFWSQVNRFAAIIFSNSVISVILVVILLEQVIFRKPKPTTGPGPPK